MSKDNFKSMQPCDWFEDKVKFPCYIQPKIDGVAAFNRYGRLIGRSLKQHENKYTTDFWSKPEYHGFCGEMISGTNPTHPDLCRITSGDLRRHEGEPLTNWYLFDYVTDATKDLSYNDRIDALLSKLDDLDHPVNIHVIGSVGVNNMEELITLENQYLDLGYEGIIIRDPTLPYKYGRCGKTFMGAWRVKRFIDAEAEIIEIEEGSKNLNEAKINERGRTERSTCKENLIPNGLVGNLKGRVLKDVLDPQTNEVLLFKDQIITISPGKMDHDLRKFYFENPSEIVGKISKFKFFPKGIKDKPRFPVWLSIRNESDIGE